MKVAILGNYPTYPFADILQVKYEGRKVATWLIYLTKYLAKAEGISELHVISEDEYIPGDRHFVYDNIHFHFLKCPKRFKALTLYYNDVKRINRTLNNIKPDIINAHHTDEYALAAIKSKYPYVITVHGILSSFVPQDKIISRQKIVGILEKYIIRKANNLIASSPFVYEAIGKFAKARFYDVENCLDETFFNRIKDYGVNYKLIYIGNIIKDKGVHDLITVVTLLKREFPQVMLTIVGNKSKYETAYYDNIIHRINEERLNNNIVFSGFITEEVKIKLLLNSTILIHPSRLETFGMSVAEAMATGTPVLVSKVGGLPYTVGENNEHSLFSYGNIEELYNKIKLIFESQKLRENYGTINKNEALKRFHPNVIVEKMQNCFNRVLNDYH